MRDAFIRALTSLAERDSSFVLVTGDLGFGVLSDFAERFPNQFINAGVAEQNMTAIAAGMALSGFRVYTYSIANFTTLRCLEQIRNDVCYHNANVTIVSVGGGFSYGQLGMSHFATEDLAILRAIPELKVVSPTEIWETEDLTSSLAEMDGPVYLRLDKSAGGVERRPGELAVLGKMRCVRDGSDVTLLATGGILAECVKAAELLAVDGIEARILAVNSLKPFDVEELERAASETGGIITIEEHSILGGLGGACAEIILERGFNPGFFSRIGLADRFPTVVGDQNYLRKVYGMDGYAIAARAREGLAKRK